MNNIDFRYNRKEAQFMADKENKAVVLYDFYVDGTRKGRDLMAFFDKFKESSYFFNVEYFEPAN